MNAMSIQPNVPNQDIVRINPSTEEGRRAVARFGNLFWHRPLQGPGAYLIPFRDGVPIVHEFIIVPVADIVRPKADVGYGQTIESADYGRV